MSGANKAIATKNSTNPPATSALRFARKRRSARLRIRGCLSTARTGWLTAISASQARVDRVIENVCHEIQQDEECRRHQHDGLDYRIVAIEYGIDDQFAESWNGEYLLGQNSAGQ